MIGLLYVILLPIIFVHVNVGEQRMRERNLLVRMSYYLLDNKEWKNDNKQQTTIELTNNVEFMYRNLQEGSFSLYRFRELTKKLNCWIVRSMVLYEDFLPGC